MKMKLFAHSFKAARQNIPLNTNSMERACIRVFERGPYSHVCQHFLLFTEVLRENTNSVSEPETRTHVHPYFLAFIEP
jgi:hypothetical protein